jgi:hypothetical protein
MELLRDDDKQWFGETPETTAEIGNFVPRF